MDLIKRKPWPLLIGTILFIQALALYMQGRPVICECGTIRFWVGETTSRENSQQIADWYSFTHIVHGLLLYGLLYLVAKRLPRGARLTLAVAIESSWEIVENSRFIIDRYRQSALAAGYVGDSILNSLSDTASMMIGFSIAGLTPLWLAAGIGLTAEIVLAYVIRDNLTLNILNLIHPFEFIQRWQGGG